MLFNSSRQAATYYFQLTQRWITETHLGTEDLTSYAIHWLDRQIFQQSLHPNPPCIQVRQQVTLAHTALEQQV